MVVAGKPALCPSPRNAREGAATVRTNKPSHRKRVMREHNNSERKSVENFCGGKCVGFVGVTTSLKVFEKLFISQRKRKKSTNKLLLHFFFFKKQKKKKRSKKEETLLFSMLLRA